MRKILQIFLLLPAFLLCACSEGEKAVPVTEEAGQEVIVGEEAAPEETGEERFGLPNPVVPVTDTSEFAMVLGIPVDASLLSDAASMSIISDEMADISWNRENVNGEEVELCFRATRNADLAPSMHGIYDEKMSDPAVTEVELKESEKITLTFREAETEGVGIYTWDRDGVFYSLTRDGEMSQMAMAEILDSCMMASGIVEPPVRLFPLPVDVDPENPEDGIYPAEFTAADISETEDGYALTARLFTAEFFDMIDVRLLQPGDVIVIGGEEVAIDAISEDEGMILLNGGLPEGGVELRTDGGVYHVSGFDDVTSYKDHGTGTFAFSEDVTLEDSFDLSRPKPKTAEGAEAVVSYLRKAEDLYISCYNATIRIEDGKIAALNFIYIP